MINFHQNLFYKHHGIHKLYLFHLDNPDLTGYNLAKFISILRKLDSSVDKWKNGLFTSRNDLSTYFPRNNEPCFWKATIG